MEVSVLFSKGFYIFIWEGGEKCQCEKETLISCDWDQTPSAGMGPDQESNRTPFLLQDDAQPTDPHFSQGQHVHFYCSTSNPNVNLSGGALNAVPWARLWF